MSDSQIITISREYGSGGRMIGKKLAEKLGVVFYDYKIIEMAAKQSGLSENFMIGAEEKTSVGLLYSLSSLASFGYSMSLNDQVFIAQSNVIREIAEKGSCVIVGRCADFILKDNPNCIHFFIHADISRRTQLAKELYSLKEEKAEAEVKKIDKQRSAYYNHYTHQKWGQASNYHLTIDSGLIGTDGAVEVIEKFIRSINDSKTSGARLYAEK